MSEARDERGTPDCWRCAAELADTLSDPIEQMLTVGGRMFLCPTCGNKRCPKATDHRLDCTDSNEPGQAGSRYGTLLFGKSEAGQ